MANKITFNMPDFSNALESAIEAATQEIGFKVEGYAKESAPADTGYYRNNIKFDNQSQIIAGASYSADLEYGTKPHIIKPGAGKKALSFQVNGKNVIVKKVKHPGTKPLAIMRKAALKTQKEVDDIFTRNFKKYV